METVKRVLAADLACHVDDFAGTGVKAVLAQKLPGRRRFPFPQEQLWLVSMDQKIVIACDEGRMPWVQENLLVLDHEDIFTVATMVDCEKLVRESNQFMAGPFLKFVCSTDALRVAPTPHRVKLLHFEGQEISQLYEYEGFGHALSYDQESPRPDVLAIAAEIQGQIIGIAGASADCPDMWQVGVQVKPSFQGRSIGKALVSELTQEILQQGKVPYYSTVLSNLTSQRLAIGLGYWPAWVELYAT